VKEIAKSGLFSRLCQVRIPHPMAKKNRPSRRLPAPSAPTRRGANDFLAPTRRKLSERVGHHCSICDRPTSGPGARAGTSVSIGVAAHITAASRLGPRFDRRLTAAQRRSYKNGIWVCQIHGRLVDSNTSRYTVRQLRKLKAEAEFRADRRVDPRRSFRTKAATGPQPDRPQMVWQATKGSPLNVNGAYLFYAAQIWFKNEPKRREAVARSLAAYLTFLINGERLFPEITGEWVVANAGDNVGFIRTTETLEALPPNGRRAKLFVLHKRIADSSAYAWSRGALEYDGGRHPSQEIPVGSCDLHVRLRGVGVDQTFRFQVINPGSGADPFINGPLPEN
jgi:hypothetical protein